MSKLLSVKFSYSGEITEPVSLAEAKEYLRIDFSDDDTLITSLITSARQKCEKILGLVLVDTTVKALYKNNGTIVELFYGPIKSDEDGIPIITGFDDSDSIKGWDGNVWIESQQHELNLTYDSGWEETPDWAKNAILKQVAWDYENRGDSQQKFAAGNELIAPETMAILTPYAVNMSNILL